MVEENPEVLAPKPPSRTPEIFLKEPWEKEVDGLHQAMHFIQQKARGIDNAGLNREDLLRIHKFVMNDPFNPEKTGVLRTVPVIVRGRLGDQVRKAAFEPADTHFLSEYFNEFASELEEGTTELSSRTTTEDVIDLASWVHKRFIEIHPFEDGNGRTARLMVDFIFRKARLPYIRSWGAVRHEYDEVVYRIYSENNLNLLKRFLAQKLVERLREIESDRSGGIWKEEFANYIKAKKQETERYLVSLREVPDAS